MSDFNKHFELISSCIQMLNSAVISMTTQIGKMDERSRRTHSNVQLLLKAADPLKTIRDKKKKSEFNEKQPLIVEE